MKPEGSLPHSLVTNTWPYPEPDKSSPCLPIPILKDRFNIILLVYQWSLSIRFSHQNFVRIFPLPIRATCSAHPIILDLIIRIRNIWWVQIIKFPFMMWSSPLPSHLIPLRPKYPPQHSILEHSQLQFLPVYARQSFTPIQNNTSCRLSHLYINSRRKL